MGIVDLNESPIRFSKEEKIIRAENNTLKDKECTVIKPGLFREKVIICKLGERIITRKI